MGSGWFGSWGVNTSGFRPGTASESGIVRVTCRGLDCPGTLGGAYVRTVELVFFSFFFFWADMIGWGLANGVAEGEKLRRQMKPKQSEEKERKKGENRVKKGSNKEPWIGVCSQIFSSSFFLRRLFVKTNPWLTAIWLMQVSRRSAC